MELSRVEKFFEGETIAFEVAKRDLSIKVTMKEAELHLRERGTDVGYDYKGGIVVHDFKGTHSKAEWEYDGFRFSSAGDLGELFHSLTEKAERLYQILSIGETKVDEMTRDSLVSYLLQIKDQAEGEFLEKLKHEGSFLRQDLYDKYMRPRMPKKVDN